MRNPDYFIHVTDDGDEIAYRDEPDPSVALTLSIWRVRDKGAFWEETLTRAPRPYGADWHWIGYEDNDSSRWRRTARRRDDIKWSQKRSSPGGQISGRARVKRKKHGHERRSGHA
jgi:hypothetical protein